MRVELFSWRKDKLLRHPLLQLKLNKLRNTFIIVVSGWGFTIWVLLTTLWLRYSLGIKRFYGKLEKPSCLFSCEVPKVWSNWCVTFTLIWDQLWLVGKMCHTQCNELKMKTGGMVVAILFRYIWEVPAGGWDQLGFYLKTKDVSWWYFWFFITSSEHFSWFVSC